MYDKKGAPKRCTFFISRELARTSFLYYSLQLSL